MWARIVRVRVVNVVKKISLTISLTSLAVKAASSACDYLQSYS